MTQAVDCVASYGKMKVVVCQQPTAPFPLLMSVTECVGRARRVVKAVEPVSMAVVEMV